MADSDNKEIMEFLGKQFEGIYKRLDNTDKKLVDMDAKIDAAKEETMRHTGVLIETVRSDIKIVIEGLTGSNEKRERDKEAHEEEHARIEKRILINTADISKLDQRAGRLEERV